MCYQTSDDDKHLTYMEIITDKTNWPCVFWVKTGHWLHPCPRPRWTRCAVCPSAKCPHHLHRRKTETNKQHGVYSFSVPSSYPKMLRTVKLCLIFFYFFSCSNLYKFEVQVYTLHVKNPLTAGIQSKQNWPLPRPNFTIRKITHRRLFYRSLCDVTKDCFLVLCCQNIVL